MKRISVFLLTAVLLFSMAGCGAAEPSQQEENFSFTYNGTQITLDAEAAPILDALGEPRSYTEEPSCAFDGMDKTYYYGSFYLSTYPLDGKDCIYNLWFADDTVATEEGIRIGSTQSQVEEAYGRDCFNGTNCFVLTRGQSRLVILMEEGKVSSIRYEGIDGGLLQ